jgi:hypothetical protein
MGTSTSSEKGAGSLEKLILDWGARIGVSALNENVKSSQLENLIVSLENFKEREALLAAAAFAQRQAQRLGVGRATARLVSQALLDLYEKGAGKEEARKMLGFAKWVFEARISPPRGVRPEQLTLESLLRQPAGGGR